jgi:histidyl-tRNA synthetase
MSEPVSPRSRQELLQAVKGMNDILPPASAAWLWVEELVRALMVRYGYAQVRTPIVEPTALFVRGLGEVTDIVEKEMYSFEDALNGDQLTLRPEATAGVVRAVNEHSLLHDGGKRLYYMGPMFRHERPQKGRYRQFHQVGAEALGFAGPDVDAELILMCRALWQALGLVEGRDVRLELNSLGQPAERLAHRHALVTHLQAHAHLLDEEASRRLHTNPLRILDSKLPAMQPVIHNAPRLLDFLGAASLTHLQAVRNVLDAVGLAYTLNPRLVRGMDYYNLTVFEWVTDHLGAQSTVCGGGRYDGLIEQLGGKSAPAVGWGLGVERLLLLLEAVGRVAPTVPPTVYAVVPDDAPLAIVLSVLESLRQHGVSVLMHAGGHGVKNQFKRADGSGAHYALIFGAQELALGEVALKPLRQTQVSQHGQRNMRIDQLPQWAPQLLASESSQPVLNLQ